MSSLRAFDLPAHFKLKEPSLRFGSPDDSNVDTNPLRGLIRHGPYSKTWIAGVPDQIRIAMIGQKSMMDRMRGLIADFETTIRPRDGAAYRPDYPGMSRGFGVHPVASGTSSEIVLPDRLTEDVLRAEKPYVVLADALQRAITQLHATRMDFDVVFIGIDAVWEPAFYERVEEDFNLHDYLKAIGASLGISVQLIRSDKALDYHCRASVMWRLAIALYTKAGGVPWVLDEIAPDTAFIGIDYAMRRSNDDGPKFAIACAQVFDAEGSGLEFIAYEADNVRVYGDNPYLSHAQMFKIIARSLTIYQRKHNGGLPKRVLVHKNTEFRDQEIDGCLDALSSVEAVELVQVQEDTGWRGYRVDRKGKIAGYPVARGTLMPLGSHEALLWSRGDLPEVTLRGGGFYKEGKGIPSPLLITRHAGRGDFQDLCRDTLGLTKMDWNNDGPYDGMPVTLNYAGRLAQIVKRMPELKPHPYPVRLFM
ncbi:argonaute/piwi family protein [Parvularcula oceani]|uniref:argonaute/piwi family protein n=1 Tax=Parvularcula oceani TaxID=1247963 RepID=UPI0004E1035E|nr:Piwi domain-containing protein [Parvularcula oceani]